MSAHLCHAKGCDTPVPPKLLMCGRHWRLVPGEVKDRIYRHYRPGQEIDKSPTKSYLNAMREAIEAVAHAEGR